ncbi:hypothetical protein D915_008299 [Fasciola hepatica]|uniref:Uncharacterized protein n=1 Tax=Fasciola hepatica TaxID=6192 RepID=A0A4E0R166_FASHE|nr:hypothetical protein D915_008299 [Fasciola hepatica]
MLKNPLIPIASLSDAELNTAIDKQRHLLESLGPKLPDGGARLRIYLEKLQSESINRAENRRISLRSLPRSFRNIGKQGKSECQSILTQKTDTSTDAAAKSAISDISPAKSTSVLIDISEQLSGLAICSGNDEDVAENDESSKDVEDLTTVPSLSLQEVTRLRYLLGLPALIVPSFRWFIFTIRLVGSLVYLAAVDCINPERCFLRPGLASTWLRIIRPQSKTSVNTTDDSDSHAKLTQPAEALRDFWEFISNQVPSTSLETASDTSVPCLICRTHSTVDGPNELVWFSRLLRNTRHYNVARASMPRDCRFVLLPTAPSPERHEETYPEKEKSAQYDRILQELQDIREEVFIQVRKENSEEHSLEVRREFSQAGITRSLPWMEAPLELEFLKELKVNNALAERLQHSVRLDDEPSKTTNRGLQEVPDVILRRLASVGLGRTRLSCLAGLAGWYGFAGLLGYRFHPNSNFETGSSDKTPNNSEDRRTSAFVTDDLQVLQDLYSFFRRVCSHMDRHSRYYREGKRSQTAPGSRILPPDFALPAFDNPSRIRAWVAGGNALFHPNAVHPARVLSVDESIELMQKAQRAYQEARMKRDLPTYPSLPPDSTKLYRYRDICRESASDAQSSEDESSSDTEVTDAESSPTASNASLHMDDVD